jgi:hypothetical protein
MPHEVIEVNTLFLPYDFDRVWKISDGYEINLGLHCTVCTGHAGDSYSYLKNTKWWIGMITSMYSLFLTCVDVE